MSNKTNAVFFLLTDFGPESIYTGQMRGVLKKIRPECDIHPLSNRVPRQDPVAAGFFLRSSLPYLPERAGVLCVVDPGVGTDRPIVAVRTAEPKRIFVGPDNGMFSVIDEQIEACHRVTDEALWLEDVSSTFHGRDIMAPTLAHLYGQTDLSDIGPAHRERAELDSPDIFEPEVREEEIRGSILFADPYGNLITNISSSDLQHTFSEVENTELQVRTKRIELSGLAHSYGDVDPGTPIALVSSANQLEISINQDSAEDVLGLTAGDRVTVEG